MTVASSAAAPGHSYPVLTVFLVFVVCAVLLSLWMTSDRDTTSEFYLGDRRFSPLGNGLALFGTYMSAATLLGTPGLIALQGYNGMPYVVGPVVAWTVMQLLIAEPYHATGASTMGDCLAVRLRPRPVHRAAGVSTLVICLLYLIAQLVGAGALAAPILGIQGIGAQRVLVAFLGILMTLYVVLGGMRATTQVQIFKAVLLLAGGAFLAFAVLSRFHWSIGGLLTTAADHSGLGTAFLRPQAGSGAGTASKLDTMSLQLALLGTAGLPHLLTRVSSVRTGRAARESVRWATILTCAFCLVAAVLGLGAAALLGTRTITADNPTGNTAVLLLAERLGGSLLVTVISCVAFATILAVVAGLTLTAATSLAHDFYRVLIARGAGAERRELLAARTSVVLIGVTATGLSMFAQGINISFMAGVAFAVAASANLPALMYNLYWKGFTTRGATWSIYGGLLSSLVLVALSPAVSANPDALLPHMDFAVFPLREPGLVSIPVGIFLGWLGSVLDAREQGGADFAETEVRALTGASAPSG